MMLSDVITIAILTPIWYWAMRLAFRGRDIARFKRQLPMSLRTLYGEHHYQQAKQRGELRPLNKEEYVKVFKHWAIIENGYPYSSVYKTCHMLIPVKPVAEYGQLSAAAKRELRLLMDTYCQLHYHQMVENTKSRRSVHDIWHLHLLTFVDKRKDIDLLGSRRSRR